MKISESSSYGSILGASWMIQVEVSKGNEVMYRLLAR